MLQHVSELPSFLWLNNTVCLLSIHLDGHLGCFHLLAVVNNELCICCCVNTNSSLRPCSQFFWICIQKWDCWVICNSICNCLRNCRTVFHSSCPILRPQQQCMAFQGLHILTNTCYFPSFYIAILMGMWGYLVWGCCGLCHSFECLLPVHYYVFRCQHTETIRPSFCHEKGISWFAGGERHPNRKL